MVSPTRSWKTPQKLTMLLLLFCITFSSFVESTTTSSKFDTEIKCGSCPCGNPCNEQLPQPSSPPPPPPSPLPLPEYSFPLDCDPPPPPPPSPPPPRPPPPPRFIYVTGVPADVYSYYSAAQNRAVELLVLLAGLGALSITMKFG